jgi:hypothetical protein
MARLFQILGWAFVLAGIMMVGLMGIMVVDGPPLTEPAGAVWSKFDRYSLGQFQVLVQRILGLPDLWDNFIVPILKAPAWQVMGPLTAISFLLGVILLFGARSSRRRGIIHRSHMS